ncbi:hypothetical protein QYM36_017287 [Artemia franciscana]|uniref:Uncharacterized protein n=1 Tax=Artemia franciscana TaxID=6661 RepID=A0AA88HA44_ARTSF|nr:hypothetical protein QYM36_017287 [Artemia franciscana]
MKGCDSVNSESDGLREILRKESSAQEERRHLSVGPKNHLPVYDTKKMIKPQPVISDEDADEQRKDLLQRNSELMIGQVPDFVLEEAVGEGVVTGRALEVQIEADEEWS